MNLKNKVTKKRGLAALLITGAVVGVSLGTTRIVKKINEQKSKSDELKRLKELEDEEFDNFLE